MGDFYVNLNNMKKVYCTKDDSGHWYVIPYEMKKEFSELRDKIESMEYSEECQGFIDIFHQKFNQYATGGDLNNIQLYAEI